MRPTAGRCMVLVECERPARAGSEDWSMKITESERERLMVELASANRNLWVEMESELQDCGGELPIWVLISDAEKIVEIYNLFLRVSKPYREKYAETDFSISFDEFKDRQMRKWNYVTPEEIRSGHLEFPLGKDYVVTAITSTVFPSLRRYVEGN